MFIVYCHITSYFKIEWLKTVITIFHAFSRSDIQGRLGWAVLIWTSHEILWSCQQALQSSIGLKDSFPGWLLTAGRLAVSSFFLLSPFLWLSYLSTWWQVSWARRASKVAPFQWLSMGSHIASLLLLWFSPLSSPLFFSVLQLFSRVVLHWLRQTLTPARFERKGHSSHLWVRAWKSHCRNSMKDRINYRYGHLWKM